MNDRIPELIILLSAAVVFFAWRWWTVWRVGQLRQSLAKALEESQKQGACLHPDGSNEQQPPTAPPAPPAG